ncbi:MAG TPA: Na/Pi symporter, partial [Bacteroidales bacterium]|nr:Na/Pi symporter [Bacteroidales bacterium]
MMLQFIFRIVGGTALLMYGVDMMGEGLERMSGKMMKRILERFTGKLWKAFLAGIFLTGLVQSSTAISVLSVGFVNSGIMKLSQAIGIIYGANIGTTITAQFMALSFSFNLIQLSLPIIAVGFILKIAGRSHKLQNAGHSTMGVGFLLLGLMVLNQGIPFMRENETIQRFFQDYASNIFLGLLIGITTTALVHSSSATVGIVILLGNAGLISLTTAVILMLGDNIGTSVTALLASINGNTNARRTAWGHALHNVIGVLMALPFLTLFVRFIEYFTLSVQGST